ncbi:MAG: thioredoxin domain-containing protein, partial [Roseburia sp.]|nr:thioredoxin domain-containing protein [Roseburia sp.]
MNHLIHEKSPYLLQHANNPVEWYPWSSEAFKKAAREDKPIFLSIGYSTCHWCHVMAHESFEDNEVAEILNHSYIAVKVDREERPDIDAVYMNVCQEVTGSGGWPLTVIMTPDQTPFFVGTYFPKHSAYGHPGLLDILQKTILLWRTQREGLLAAGMEITENINRQEEQRTGTPNMKLLEQGAELLFRSYDIKYGGFGYAPKFPVPHNLFFLMRYAVMMQNRKYLGIVEHTLGAMAEGGIFDHIGGGFSRYSTDDKWLIPHFEKMLYDNALLAIAYLECYQLTKNPFFENIARRTLNYVLDELTGPEGEFYCGQDADSEGVEGKYYYFTPEEIISVLGEERGLEFCRAYDISNAGNFEGKSIPNRIGQNGPLSENVKQSREILYEYRKSRTKLHLDDKVILSWNAWMILAMAKAHFILEDEKYGLAARRAHSFLVNHMTTGENRLFLRWRDGDAAYSGNLDDYAVYGLALCGLYEMTYEPAYLKEASLRAEQMLTFFEDKEQGGYYLTASDAETLIARPKETYDGAIPSGNSTAAVLLGRLSKYTGEIKWQEASLRQNMFLAGEMEQIPYGHSLGLLALMEALFPSKELVCVSTLKVIPESMEKHKQENEIMIGNKALIAKFIAFIPMCMVICFVLVVPFVYQGLQ